MESRQGARRTAWHVLEMMACARDDGMCTAICICACTKLKLSYVLPACVVSLRTDGGRLCADYACRP
jgi:hypothetical protein